MPTKEEFELIKVQRAQEAAQKIASEKKSREEAKVKSESIKKYQQQQLQMPSSSPATLAAAMNTTQNMISNAVSSSRRQLKFTATTTAGAAKVKLGHGYAATAGAETIENDPIGQQILNLKKFIQQAKHAGQYDDARILEDNLKDLQVTY